MDKSARICVGEITTPHGVRGLLRVRVFTEGADDLFALGALSDAKGQPVKLTSQGAGKDFLIVAVDGVADRNKAETLRGTKLYVPREALPQAGEGEYYLSDLEGMQAVLTDGTSVGTIRAVLDFGAGTLLEIVRPGAEPLLLPFTDSFVPSVDVAAKMATIVMPEMLDGEERPGGKSN